MCDRNDPVIQNVTLKHSKGTTLEVEVKSIDNCIALRLPGPMNSLKTRVLMELMKDGSVEVSVWDYSERREPVRTIEVKKGELQP